jgi:2'-5' RNA ligase
MNSPVNSAGGKTHAAAVVVIPPEEAWPPIQSIRRQHDRGFGRWMPHITMLYPFRPRREFGVATRQLGQACAGTSPFEVTLATFDSFEHGRESYTLWLAPEPTDDLIQLQTALWQVFPDCDEVRRHTSGFTPHLSIGQAQGRERMEQLVAAWGSTWTPLRFRVSEVSLIWRGDPPDDVFRVAQAIRLGGGLS